MSYLAVVVPAAGLRCGAAAATDRLEPSGAACRPATAQLVRGVGEGVGVLGLDILGSLWMGTAHDFSNKKGLRCQRGKG